MDDQSGQRVSTRVRRTWAIHAHRTRRLEERTTEPRESQRNFESQISRYASQSKTKEPSTLREDAFQLHEARKAYLKASMDFCQLLVKIFSDRWREMKASRDSLATNMSKWSGDVDRSRNWSKEMENDERI